MIKVKGQVTGVFITNTPGSLRSTRVPEACVTFLGFEGDKHAGMTSLSGGRFPRYPHGTEIRNSRQVSICSLEELDQIAANLGLPALLGEWLGTNLTLKGIPSLTQLPPSSRMYFRNGVTLVVEAENFPCTTAGESIQKQFPQILDLGTRFPKAAMHKRGIVCWVERPGTIPEGDEVEVEIPSLASYEP